MGHDIRYTLAENFTDIRKADNIMINKLKSIERNRGDDSRNINMGKRLIQAKTVAEDLGILDKERFSGNLKNNRHPKNELELLKANLDPLQQQGYGLNAEGGMLPADMLRMKLLKQMSKTRKKKHKGGKRDFGGTAGTHGNSSTKTFSGMKGYKLSGSGLSLPGGRLDLHKLAVDKLVPAVFKSMGIPQNVLPKTLISKVIKKGISMAGNTLPSFVHNIAKSILPLIEHGFMKHKGMGGRGIIKPKHKNNLIKLLKMGIMKTLKVIINKKGMGGRGISSFFKGFAKGFRLIAKPGLKIIGAVATATGVPEVGIPASIVSGLL